MGWFPQKYVELLPSSGKKKENATPLRSISTASTTSAASVVSAKPQERSPGESLFCSPCGRSVHILMVEQGSHWGLFV